MPNHIPERRVRRTFFGKKVVETKCEFCGRFFDLTKAVGHIEREDGIQHFFVCELCAKLSGLDRVAKGTYRLAGEKGFMWRWTPKANAKTVQEEGRQWER